MPTTALQQEQQQQPLLVASLDDEDDNDSISQQEKLAYVLRYESMVRQQEAEDLATLQHLGPCLERLEALIDSSMDKKKNKKELVWTRPVSYTQLQQALTVAENDVLLSTDRQLLLVLKLLTQQQQQQQGTCKDNGENSSALTWAEFLQAYKTCISGMMTLQHLPAGDDIRPRTRERTLALLSLFQQASTQLLQADAAASNTTNHHSATTRPLEDAALTDETQRPGAAAHVGFSNRPRMHSGGGKSLWRMLQRTVVVLALLCLGFCAGTHRMQQQQQQPSPLVVTREPTLCSTETSPPLVASVLTDSHQKTDTAAATKMKSTTTTTRVQSTLPKVHKTTTAQLPTADLSATGTAMTTTQGHNSKTATTTSQQGPKLLLFLGGTGGLLGWTAAMKHLVLAPPLVVAAAVATVGIAALIGRWLGSQSA